MAKHTHEHIHCGTDACCGECQEENNMSSMSEVVARLEAIEARLKVIEEKLAELE